MFLHKFFIPVYIDQYSEILAKIENNMVILIVISCLWHDHLVTQGSDTLVPQSFDASVIFWSHAHVPHKVPHTVNNQVPCRYWHYCLLKEKMPQVKSKNLPNFSVGNIVVEWEPSSVELLHWIHALNICSYVRHATENRWMHRDACLDSCCTPHPIMCNRSDIISVDCLTVV